MDSNKNQRISKRGADIDQSSLNLLIVILATIILMLVILASYLIVTLAAREDAAKDDPPIEDGNSTQESTYPFRVDGIVIELPDTDEAKNIIDKDSISADKAILVDITSGEIIASRQAGQIIYPASMTKVMTLVVVAENLKNESSLDDIITISREYNGNSGYGFKVGETLTVEDLIYAAVLQSDGVACLELADYIAGSEANFVKLMNEKARALGLDEKTTLFQNCTGLHHSLHYSTCRDMAIIMAYAMENPFSRSVLTALSYRPGDNFRPGDGCIFWHTLLHQHLSDGNRQPKKAEIIGGKTGWTGDDSGYCVVSYIKGDDGHFYICVTSKAESWSATVQDTITISNEYIK